ncbi:antibiotic biosynthesis monooxygenase [Halobellus sp. GM3]|uniref:antibiotic biosynthesis monooxygenase n=1 Tax=Halobellus sp. GM3 TaxID=3458410 RepID=UPI00403E324D
MIVVHANFPIAPDRREDALELAEMLVEASNREPGVIEYRATTDVVDENVIRFIERYEDEDAFAAHTGTEHFQKLEAQLPDLLGGDPEVMRYEVSEAVEVEL